MIIQGRSHSTDPRTHGDQVFVPHFAKPLVIQDCGSDLGPVGRRVGDLRALQHFQHGLRVRGRLIGLCDYEDTANSLSCVPY